MICIPVVYVLDILQSYLCPVSFMQVLDYPLYEVVFEGPLYELVQEVRGKEFMDVGSRKGVRKWLMSVTAMSRKFCMEGDIANIPLCRF